MVGRRCLCSEQKNDGTTTIVAAMRSLCVCVLLYTTHSISSRPFLPNLSTRDISHGGTTLPQAGMSVRARSQNNRDDARPARRPQRRALAVLRAPSFGSSSRSYLLLLLPTAAGHSSSCRARFTIMPGGIPGRRGGTAKK